MRRCDILRLLLALALGTVLTWGGVGFGCNPTLIASLGGEANLPTAPGASNPYVLMRWVNAVTGPVAPGTTTPIGVDYLATWRFAGGQSSGWTSWGSGLEATEDFGLLVPCNVTVITLGEVNDLTQPGAWLSYYGTTVTQPLVPFGKLLQNGVDFRCGDTVTFVTYNEPSTSRGYAIDYQVQSGQEVTGPFSGPDTFAMYTQAAGAWETWATAQGFIP